MFQRYVIVVEHDLSVLDYLSDFICCLYGGWLMGLGTQGTHVASTVTTLWCIWAYSGLDHPCKSTPLCVNRTRRSLPSLHKP